jgi:hypothetical protein
MTTAKPPHTATGTVTGLVPGILQDNTKRTALPNV